MNTTNTMWRNLTIISQRVSEIHFHMSKLEFFNWVGIVSDRFLMRSLWCNLQNFQNCSTLEVIREKITAKKNLNFFTWQFVFYFKKKTFSLKEIFPKKQSEFEIFLSVESYDKKNCRKFAKFLRCQKPNNFQIINDIDSKFW